MSQYSKIIENRILKISIKPKDIEDIIINYEYRKNILKIPDVINKVRTWQEIYKKYPHLYNSQENYIKALNNYHRSDNYNSQKYSYYIEDGIMNKIMKYPKLKKDTRKQIFTLNLFDYELNGKYNNCIPILLETFERRRNKEKIKSYQ